MKSIEHLEEAAEAEGFKPGTDGFDKRIRQLKVLQCQESRNVQICSQCDLYLYCDLIAAVRKDKLEAARKKAENKEPDR